MNTIFLVKKNPNLPNSQTNWLMMEYEDFKSFINSKEGTARRYSFTYLLPAEKGDYGIVIECSEEDSRACMKENNRSKYINRTLFETGYRLVSYYSTVRKSDGTYTFEDVLSAENDINVEDAAILSIQIKALRAALKLLTEEEYALINMLYISETILSETAAAAQMSLPRTSFQYFKAIVLDKLRFFILENA